MYEYYIILLRNTCRNTKMPDIGGNQECWDTIK